jgi:hypothetical protein
MGEAGRQVLEEEHKPEAYVEAVLALTISAQRFRPIVATAQLAARIGEQMQSWMTSAALAETLTKVAAEMHALTGGDETPVA